MKSGVYKITNKESGKCYIGSGLNIFYRLKTHRGKLNRNIHHSIILQRSWNKNGEEGFSFEPLLICAPKDRIFYEQLCMDFYKSHNREFGYNIRKKAESNEGLPMHENTRKAIIKHWQDPEFRKNRNVPEPGERHGRLVLLELKEKTAGSYTWLCKCDCGKECLKKVACLRRKDTLSCGCLNAELASKRRKERTGVLTTFVELRGDRIGIREAEKRIGVGKNVITRKARVKKLSLQQATDYFAKQKGLIA